MVLGLLPAIRGGLGDLARTGQHARLLRGYLAPYARAFDEVRYFSYLDETLARYTGTRRCWHACASCRAATATPGCRRP
jgi:hypothetical protein